jgi:hypothetical protein
MADWFAKLMQRGHARGRPAIAGAGVSNHPDVGTSLDSRDARHAIIRMLRDRDAEDRDAREKRQRWYRQSLETDSGIESTTPSLSAPARLHRFRTKVPCRVTPEARALLAQLKKRFSGSTVTFQQTDSRRQAVMLTRAPGSEPKQIGWLEHCVQTDPRLCNVRNQGLVVETDGDTMLLLRFRYPATAVRMSARHIAEEATLPPNGSRRIDGRVSLPQTGDDLELPCSTLDAATHVDFTEIRPALELRPPDKSSSPRLVWITRPEIETMNALRSRDYEAFYVRFKLELQAGIWSSLTALLSTSPASQCHQGSYYTVVREPDPTTRKIYQRTIDDCGRAVDIGSDRIYDAASATDIVLLYLDGDILADIAEIYFTLQSLGSADAYFLKEELFTVVRRFWANSQSLTSRYGSDLAAVERMSQRTLPMPAQAPLLKQDWTNLRQLLVDRYGEAGLRAADLVGHDVHRPRIGPAEWPFTSFPAGEVNVGLRLIFRQEWRHLGAQRGECIRTVPPAAERAQRESIEATPGARTRSGAGDLRKIETTVEQGDTARSLDEVVNDALRATVDAMKWPLDFEGSINLGVRGLAAATDMGLETECRESSADISTRLSDIMHRMASRIRDETAVAVTVKPEEGSGSSLSTDVESPTDEDAATFVYSRLQNRYEVLTRPGEIQNVVLVAEKLPAPAEIDLSWVRRHDWILRKVLLDETFRDALDTIGQEAQAPNASEIETGAKRDRLYDHLRANVLHYQRAIWRQEDPHQRSMRYRKSGKKVPLEWRFELESGGALTIDELGERLAGTNVDGQFAAYSSGRTADLDQVIDPAGLIGYYGNYAIYHMRPAFGSEDLFSMLHFFKSPYLRPNPESGEPEVEDPMQIQISEDPGLFATSDQLIEQHRNEIVSYVPELRLELARARKSVSDGTDPSALESLEQQPGTLRRHFARYLFRRERTRRITLDTDGVVIDAIRRERSTPEQPRDSDDEMGLGKAPDGYQLILESGCGIELVRPNGYRATDTEWAILRSGGERAPNLRAGGTQNPEGGPVILAQAARDQLPDLRAGRTVALEAEPMILPRDDEHLRVSSAAGSGASQNQEPMIISGSIEERTPSLLAGPANHPDAEPAIRAQSDGERIPGLLAGRVRALDAEQLIRARNDEGLRLIAAAGARASEGHEHVVRSEGHQELTLSLRAGRIGDREAEQVILAQGDSEQRVTDLVAGRPHALEAERVILAAHDEGLRLTSGTGAGPSQARERVILATGDEERTPKLLAGAGAARAHERVIRARDDEWLRPSLIAG